uniref:Uncharacterized protein n=1 Tax=Arundo donax TaxID=35708 RepID=A0A0A8Y9J6_ARUDO
MGEVCKRKPEELKYYQRLRHGQGCVKVNYLRAKIIIMFRDFMGFNSSLL